MHKHETDQVLGNMLNCDHRVARASSRINTAVDVAGRSTTAGFRDSAAERGVWHLTTGAQLGQRMRQEGQLARRPHQLLLLPRLLRRRPRGPQRCARVCRWRRRSLRFPRSGLALVRLTVDLVGRPELLPLLLAAGGCGGGG